MKERSTESHTADNSSKARPGMDTGFDNVNDTSDLKITDNSCRLI